MKHTQWYREDYPRPQMVRNDWESLDGKWHFRFDERNIGEKEHWEEGFESKLEINVPFTYETSASGIGEEKQVQVIWYSRSFLVTDLSKDTLIHFEGSDYTTDVWINGVYIGENHGAYHRFTFNITNALQIGNNIVTVRVKDGYSKEQVRGKQRWKDQNFGCWYTQTTGIYKSVWLERVNGVHVKQIHFVPDLSADKLRFSIRLIRFQPRLAVKIVVSYNGTQVAESSAPVSEALFQGALDIPVADQHFWTAETPDLYDVTVYLYENKKIIDTVGSYFGWREIKAEGQKLMLNGKPLYLKMVLDQGYWPESGLTPPDTEALYEDIRLTKAMGFNGVRKHQKIEDERYLYLADVMGLYVWCEMPSMYAFSESSVRFITQECSTVIARTYNHPSIITWVLFNESWGIPNVSKSVRQQSQTLAMYYAARAIDMTRPIISNDGWEHTKSDILTLHNYTQDPQALREGYVAEELATKRSPIQERLPFSQGFGYENQPIVFSEYGGVACVEDTDGNSWGYGEPAGDAEELLQRFTALTEVLQSLPYCSGYCYTQLTDVEQEVNGLLRADRTPKVDVEKIKKINDQK